MDYNFCSCVPYEQFIDYFKELEEYGDAELILGRIIKDGYIDCSNKEMLYGMVGIIIDYLLTFSPKNIFIFNPYTLELKHLIKKCMYYYYQKKYRNKHKDESIHMLIKKMLGIKLENAESGESELYAFVILQYMRDVDIDSIFPNFNFEYPNLIDEGSSIRSAFTSLSKRELKYILKSK